jgi:hypothetical protein
MIRQLAGAAALQFLAAMHRAAEARKLRRWRREAHLNRAA